MKINVKFGPNFGIFVGVSLLLVIQTSLANFIGHFYKWLRK